MNGETHHSRATNLESQRRIARALHEQAEALSLIASEQARITEVLEQIAAALESLKSAPGAAE